MAVAVSTLPPFSQGHYSLPPMNFVTATPSDSANEAFHFSRIYIGGGGNLPVVRYDGSVVLFASVQAGSTIQAVGIRINSTNLTASQVIIFQ